MLKKCRIVLVLLTGLTSVAQKHISEVGLILENDLYTSSVNDKYYTNGFEIYYRYLNHVKKGHVVKNSTEFRVVQYIYNPQTIRAANFFVNDRPFAALLFAEAGFQKFFVKEQVLKYSFQLGFMGKNAFGEEVQQRFHKTFGYERVEGWQYQIDDALLVQAAFFYAKNMVVLNDDNTIDLLAQAEIKAGTILNEITAGPVLRMGFKNLLPVSESNLYDASLRYDKNYRETTEFYFFISPKLNYQIYDATIQGRLWSDASPVTFDLVRFRFQGQAGFKFRKNNWNLHYTFNYTTQEAENIVNKGYFYGSIGVGYLLQ
jgi:hypothetical protein